VKLFHATTGQFEPGSILTDPRESNFYPSVVTLLENARPNRAPSRARAFFAADTSEFATLFLCGQNVPRERIRLYEVQILAHYKAPIALVHEIMKRLEKDPLGVPSVVTEYWDPRMNWKFYECFGPEMVVDCEVSIPLFGDTALSWKYSMECELAESVK